jgi:hypothetical protein
LDVDPPFHLLPSKSSKESWKLEKQHVKEMRDRKERNVWGIHKYKNCSDKEKEK